MMRENVGAIKTASIPATAFNQQIKMIVECEKAIVVVLATPSVPIGTTGEILTFSDESRWFTWEGARARWRCE